MRRLKGKNPISKGGGAGAFWVFLAGMAGGAGGWMRAGGWLGNRTLAGEVVIPTFLRPVEFTGQLVHKRPLVMLQVRMEPVLHEHVQVFAGVFSVHLVAEAFVVPVSIRIAGADDKFLNILARYWRAGNLLRVFQHHFRHQPDCHSRVFAFQVGSWLPAGGFHVAQLVTIAAAEGFSGVDNRLGQRLANALVVRCDAEG